MFIFNASQFNASVFALFDSTDVTKKLAFDLSGITTETTRTITAPDANVSLVPGTTYAAASHDHDADYAALGHNHDADYADIAHVHDADVITYTPAVATDWDGDADPGDVNDALDQLAERVDDLENAGGGGTAEIAVGIYTGNGSATQAITGVGFQPDAVFIGGHAVGAADTLMAADTMSGNAIYADGIFRYASDHVTAFGADGFTVGDGTGTTNVHNVNSRAYTYIALKA
jgi:hypothetical protein